MVTIPFLGVKGGIQFMVVMEMTPYLEMGATIELWLVMETIRFLVEKEMIDFGEIMAMTPSLVMMVMTL